MHVSDVQVKHVARGQRRELNIVNIVSLLARIALSSRRGSALESVRTPREAPGVFDASSVKMSACKANGLRIEKLLVAHTAVAR